MYNFPGYGELKRRARKVLSSIYWLTFLASLITAILGGEMTRYGVNLNFGSAFTSFTKEYEDEKANNGIEGFETSPIETSFITESDWSKNQISDLSENVGIENTNNEVINNEGVALTAKIEEFIDFNKNPLPFIAAFMTIWVVALIVIYLFRFFVSYPVTVGFKRFLLNGAEDTSSAKLDDLFYVFRCNYMKTSRTMFLREIYIMLWSLLLIIPGIIEAYNLLLVPFIISDNPDIDRKRVLQISRDTMRGYKWKAFVLNLTFIGWYLLVALTCGLGMLFLSPYIESTYAQFYLTMRERAITEKIATPEEFGFVKAVQPQPFADPFQTTYENTSNNGVEEKPYNTDEVVDGTNIAD
jgi:uncharacterized membrane protein